jgi:hypothetical protein
VKKSPAVNSNTKTETMATSDIRKALLFMASTSDVVVVVSHRRRSCLRPGSPRLATISKNRAEFII